jgi:hypothetical protein
VPLVFTDWSTAEVEDNAFFRKFWPHLRRDSVFSNAVPNTDNMTSSATLGLTAGYVCNVGVRAEHFEWSAVWTISVCFLMTTGEGVSRRALLRG